MFVRRPSQGMRLSKEPGNLGGEKLPHAGWRARAWSDSETMTTNRDAPSKNRKGAPTKI
jgi:hypothetical protein